MVARTRYERPRYLPIVFALAGDSTITSDVPPGSLRLLSSMISGSACFAFDARDAVFVARFFAVVFAAALVVLARAIFLVYRVVVVASGRIFQTSSFEKPTQIVERDASIELHQRALDDVFELRPANRPRPAERQQMPPRFGRKPSPLMRTHYPERGM